MGASQRKLCEYEHKIRLEIMFGFNNNTVKRLSFMEKQYGLHTL